MTISKLSVAYKEGGLVYGIDLLRTGLKPLLLSLEEARSMAGMPWYDIYKCPVINETQTEITYNITEPICLKKNLN